MNRKKILNSLIVSGLRPEMFRKSPKANGYFAYFFNPRILDYSLCYYLEDNIEQSEFLEMVDLIKGEMAIDERPRVTA